MDKNPPANAGTMDEFNPQSRKIPQTWKQLSPSNLTTAPVLQSPPAATTEARTLWSPCTATREACAKEQPPLTTARESLHAARKTQCNQINNFLKINVKCIDVKMINVLCQEIRRKQYRIRQPFLLSHSKQYASPDIFNVFWT